MFEAIHNKRVLVTGSSSGIGASIAKLFSAHGARVGIHYANNIAGAQKVLCEINELKGIGKLFQGNLLESLVRKNLISEYVKEFGGIDVLINNAGAVYEYKNFADLEEDSWDRTFAVNVKAPFYLSRDAFREMRNHDGGRIINIGSVATKYVGAASMHYAASKAALDTLTRGFSREGAKHNILVNSIRCGLIDTPMHTKIEGYKRELFEKRIKLVPLGRAGDPQDIARMALFLASECGDFVTGEIFTVAGGD